MSRYLAQRRFQQAQVRDVLSTCSPTIFWSKTVQMRKRTLSHCKYNIPPPRAMLFPA